MTETQPRQKVFFSESLNDIITFIMIPCLSDEDLTKLFYELLELNTALRARVKLLKAMDLPEYEMEQLSKALKKHIVVDQFKVQVNRELERRFQKAQNLTKDEITELVENRHYLYENKLTKKTLEIMCDLLEDTYGESVVSTIRKQALEKAVYEVIQ